MNALYRPRRTFLYVPGSDPHKIAKAAALPADCICLDLEDSVSPDLKATARAAVANSLLQLDFGTSERLVRINAIDSGLAWDDLNALVSARPDGIVIPKVASAAQVREVVNRIGLLEGAAGIAAGTIGVWALIESARGIVNLAEIANADARLRGLIFGAEDYAVDVGVTKTREGFELLYAQSAVVTHAAVFGLVALDMVYTDFRDVDGLWEHARRGMQLGFAGMQVIHPNQVALVQETYSPDAAQVAQAQRILEAGAGHFAAGRGAFALDGEMVDLPIYRAAQRVMARAASK